MGDFVSRAMSYETVAHEVDLPFRCFFNSIDYLGSHWHRELELILQIDGEITISSQDGTVTLAPGDVFLANPFEVHSLVKRTDNNLELALQIDLSSAMLMPGLLGQRRFSRVGAWSGDTRSTVKHSLVQIAGELATLKEGYALACMSSLTGTRATLLRSTGNAANRTPSLDNNPAWFDHINAIIGYLEENYVDPVALDDVADHVGLSRYYVSHLVKSVTGLSFQENLGLIRTDHAVHLLLSTNRRLIDIAMDSGFSHLKYLTKHFVRLYGQRPSEIRDRRLWRQHELSDRGNAVRYPTVELVTRAQSVLDIVPT